LRDSAALALLYYAGLRATEVVQVDLDDIELKRGELVRRGPEPVTLQLFDAAPILARYLTSGRPHLIREAKERALFLNLRGKRLSRQGLWLVVKRWATEADLGADLSPHSLRHSLIRHLLQRGKSKREIQAMLGLSSPNAIRVRVASKR
jgi:integrase/recombinase XerD